MAGNDRTLASQMALNAQARALESILLVPDLLKQIQTELIAQQQARTFKKPAVFYSGGQFDFDNSYPIVGKDASSVNFLAMGCVTIKTLNIQDADCIRFGYSGAAISSKNACFLAVAFSASTNFQEIPLNQFFLINASIFLNVGSINFSSLFPFAGTTTTTGTIDPVSGAVNEDTDYTELQLTGNVTLTSPKTFGVNIWENLPCAGNRYMHVMGSIFGVDLHTNLGAGLSAFTYALIK